jgi:uncharacterized membrane protein
MLCLAHTESDLLETLKFIHLLSIVVWLGMLIFFTFIGAPAIFRELPRETAGQVVGRIFPKYWLTGYIASVLSLATLGAASFMQRAFPAWRILILIAMTVISFYSGLVVGKKARSLKARIKQGSDDKEALKRDFKKVHALSAVLNITVIALGLVLVWLIAGIMGP